MLGGEEQRAALLEHRKGESMGKAMDELQAALPALADVPVPSSADSQPELRPPATA